MVYQNCYEVRVHGLAAKSAFEHTSPPPSKGPPHGWGARGLVLQQLPERRHRALRRGAQGPERRRRLVPHLAMPSMPQLHVEPSPCWLPFLDV